MAHSDDHIQERHHTQKRDLTPQVALRLMRAETYLTPDELRALAQGQAHIRTDWPLDEAAARATGLALHVLQEGARQRSAAPTTEERSALEQEALKLESEISATSDLPEPQTVGGEVRIMIHDWPVAMSAMNAALDIGAILAVEGPGEAEADLRLDVAVSRLTPAIQMDYNDQMGLSESHELLDLLLGARHVAHQTLDASRNSGDAEFEAQVTPASRRLRRASQRCRWIYQKPTALSFMAAPHPGDHAATELMERLPDLTWTAETPRTQLQIPGHHLGTFWKALETLRAQWPDEIHLEQVDGDTNYEPLLRLRALRGSLAAELISELGALATLSAETRRAIWDAARPYLPGLRPTGPRAGQLRALTHALLTHRQDARLQALLALLEEEEPQAPPQLLEEFGPYHEDDPFC